MMDCSSNQIKFLFGTGKIHNPSWALIDLAYAPYVAHEFYCTYTRYRAQATSICASQLSSYHLA